MIFGFYPEHRDGAHLVFARYALGQLDRTEGFQERVERTAEEPRLLAGDHHQRVGLGEPTSELLRARMTVGRVGALEVAGDLRALAGSRFEPGQSARHGEDERRQQIVPLATHELASEPGDEALAPEVEAGSGGCGRRRHEVGNESMPSLRILRPTRGPVVVAGALQCKQRPFRCRARS